MSTKVAKISFLDACFDPKSPYALKYRVHLVFPVKLTNALAISGEIELSEHWNSFLVRQPEVLKRTKSTRMTVCSQTSAMMGMLKNESLDEIFRYIDEDAGIVVESMSSVQEDNPLYFKPSRGYKRTEAYIKSVWMACGPDHTLLRQTGTLTMPFPLTKTLLSTLSGLIGKYILGGLVKNANKSLEPGNPWEDAISKDVNDFYRRLNNCVESQPSRRRVPRGGRVSFDASEIASCAHRYQVQ